MCGNGAGFDAIGNGSTGSFDATGGLSFGQTFGGLSAFQSLTSGFQSFQNASVQQSNFEYQKQVALRNQQIAEVQIEDAKRRGQEEKNIRRRAGLRDRASIKAGFASRNILISGGAPLDILQSSGVLEAADKAKIGENTQREKIMLGLKRDVAANDAEFYGARSKAASPGLNFASSLLSSGLSSGMKYL